MKRVLLALLVCVPLTASAVEAGKDLFVHGDAEAGAGQAAACAACHGPNGKSAVAQWPKLAGQGSVYTLAQLQAFKTGARKNPIMQAQAAPLSEQQMRDLAAFFMEQEPAPGVASEASIAVAQPIYRGGVAERGVPACSACHGPTGAGNVAAGYPRIAGQHAEYVAARLRAYRASEPPATPGARMMVDIASQLSDDEIDALASYVNGLQ